MFEDIYPQQEPKPVKQTFKKKKVSFALSKKTSLAEQVRRLDNSKDFKQLIKILDITKSKVHRGRKSKQ